MIVGPASRRPIRARVDPRRAARRSDTALVRDAIWSRVFPSNTCVNRDLTKIKVPKTRGHNPHDSRSPNPHLAEVPGQQRASHPLHSTRKTPPHRGAGYAIVLEPPPGSAPRPAQWRYRAPSGSAPQSWFSRRRGRPPARHRRGRSPLNQPTRDHADGATLGRRDANASRRPRRPAPIEPRSRVRCRSRDRGRESHQA